MVTVVVVVVFLPEIAKQKSVICYISKALETLPNLI
jgi:hypothetical protein